MRKHLVRRIREKISAWWERRGNNTLPMWYFRPLFTFEMISIITIAYGAFTYVTINTVVRYLLQEQLDVAMPPPSLFDVLWITFILSFSGILFLASFYLRKRTAYSFKNEPRVRKCVLKRSRWTSLFKYAAALFFLLAVYFSTAFFVFLSPPLRLVELPVSPDALAFAISIFPIGFASFLTLFLCSLLFGIFIHSGLEKRERLVYILDSLLNLGKPKQQKSYGTLNEDIEYLADDFVTSFGRLLLSSKPISCTHTKEVDLGSHLTPILLALFLGNAEEKAKAREMLAELQGYLKQEESEWQIDTFNWFSRTGKEFPRFAGLRDAMQLESRVRRGIFSETAESLKYIAAISTIASALIVLVDWILSFMR